jgi:Uma2 family endonuclease
MQVRFEMALLQKSEDSLMTGEELLHRPDLNPCELVNGRVVPLSPTGYVHGEIELDLGGELRSWARSTGLGRASVGEVGIYTRRNPDTVRAGDVVYISNERFARKGTSGYLDVAPELVVEVLSPDDRKSDVITKVKEYLSAGVDRVWVVDSKLQTILAYRSMEEVQQLKAGDVLADEELLPGFRLPLADLFKG